MYFLRYRVFPAANHTERDRYGEGWVCCWIDRRTLSAADKAARRDIEGQFWEIIEREAAEKVTAPDYEGDDWLAYYQQALADKEVFLYNLSPRFPVYVVLARVEQASPPEVADAAYFVSGESLLRKGEADVTEPNFWDAARQRRVLTAARREIRNAGWTVKAIREHWPCGRGDLAEDMVLYYDEAEADGACLVFIHDGDKPPPRGKRKPKPK